MKRKSVAVLLVGIMALAACSVSGCTSTTAKDYSQHYNDVFKGNATGVDVTMVSPFSKSKSTDNKDLYTGLFKATGSTNANATVTVEIMPSQTAAQTKFDQVVANQLSAEYSNTSSKSTAYDIGDATPMGTVTSAWSGAKAQDSSAVFMFVIQDPGADNNWTLMTMTFTGVSTSGASTTTTLGETSASQATTSNPTVNVTATSLGEATVIKSTYGSVQTTPLPGYKFVKFAMYFRNINAPNTTMGNPLEVTLRDKQGNLYSYDSSQFTMQPEQVGGQSLKGLQYQSDTQPGEKVSGIIIFEIPQSAQPKNLTYYDYKNRIVIDL